MARQRELYFDPMRPLPRDSGLHRWMFGYIASYLRYLRWAPSWYYGGIPGMWMAPMTNNYIWLAPYRWPGYLAVALFGLSPDVAYKWTFLVVGDGLFLAGLYLLAQRLWGKPWIAALAAVLAVFSSTTIALYHQEQALGTTFFLPFLWLALLECENNPRAWPAAAAIAGWSLNVHYPQLQLCYWLCLAAALPFSRRSRKFVRNVAALMRRRESRRWLVLSAASLVIAASPLVYSYFGYRRRLVSSFRAQASSVDAATWEDYRSMSRWIKASVPPYDLLAYLHGGLPLLQIDRFDDLMLSSTSGVALGLLSLAAVETPLAGFQAAALGLLLVLSCGILGPGARLLWWVLPGVRLFRQWIHLLPIVNLHLLFLAVASVAALLAPEERGARARWLTAAAGALAAALSGIGLLSVSQGLTAATPLGLKAASPRGRRGVVPWAGATAAALLLAFGVRWAERKTPPLADEPRVTLPAPWTWADFARLAVSNEHPRIALAEPKMAAPARVGFAQWGLDDGRAAMAGDSDLDVQPAWRGLSIRALRAPRGARALILPDFDDGCWKVAGPQGPVQLLAPGELVAYQLPPDGAAVRLQRPVTAWDFLIAAMWLPAAAFLLL